MRGIPWEICRSNKPFEASYHNRKKHLKTEMLDFNMSMTGYFLNSSLSNARHLNK